MNSDQRGCLLAVLSALGRFLTPNRPANEGEDVVDAELGGELPYRIRDDFLSPTETQFYIALVSAVGERAIICPKVRLGDILYTTDRGQFWKHTNRVNQKHVDFLLCHPKTVTPWIAIELDDASHRREEQQERDQFKDDAFKAAGLPLVRVKARRNYSAGDLSEILRRLEVAPARPTPFASLIGDAVPTCPTCGTPMVERTATRGGNIGKRFYGCPNYPRCRETVSNA